MSSHREAPEISKDPTADGTDVYAFMNPNTPNRVVLIANFIPLQKPDGGPNFYEFDDEVLYQIKVSNTDEGIANVSYQFKFTTEIRNRNTFLYNTGPINDIGDPTWNRPQYYSVTRIINGVPRVLASRVPVPPVNVGPRSMPDYPKLGRQGVQRMGPSLVFAGQRADAFHVDLGSVFDLGALRPFNEAHLISMPNMGGVDSVQTYNVHTIALTVPTSELTANRRNATSDVNDRNNVIGVWATASRRKGRVWNAKAGKYVGNGPWVQVSRLANPLFNEVIVPMSRKDSWNAAAPRFDSAYAPFVNAPELGGLLPALYPGVFPNLKAYAGKKRADLDAILLTGIPKGVVPGFQNYTGPVKADLLRLNMAVPPTPAAEVNKLGLVAGDPAGFPNGRRPIDDVVTIELRAVAGLTIPLVDPDYTPDAAASAVEDGTDNAENSNGALLPGFPFLGHPNGGYQTTPGESAVTS